LKPSLGVRLRYSDAIERARRILRERIQRAKARRVITADVVADFAKLHMRTADGRAIAPAAHHTLWLHLMCDPAIKRLLIVGTPESAKTTWALAYAACHIGFFPEQPLIVAAVSEPVAEARSIALRNIIESDEFAQTFPTVQPAAGMLWTTAKWSVAEEGRPHAGRLHPTVSAYGTGGSVTGSRAQLLIADDILDYDNTRTQHQRNVVDTWFHTSLLPRLMAQTGRAVVIGNTYHHADTIALLRRSEGWATCHIPLLSESEEVVASITYPSDFAGRPIGVPVAGALPA
jgi:hypothetical protein